MYLDEQMLASCYSQLHMFLKIKLPAVFSITVCNTLELRDLAGLIMGQRGVQGSTMEPRVSAGCCVWLRRLLIQNTIPRRLHCGAEGCVKLNGEAKGCCKLRVMADCTVKDKGMARVRAGPLGDDNVPYDDSSCVKLTQN